MKLAKLTKLHINCRLWYNEISLLSLLSLLRSNSC